MGKRIDIPMALQQLKDLGHAEPTLDPREKKKGRCSLRCSSCGHTGVMERDERATDDRKWKLHGSLFDEKCPTLRVSRG